MAAIRLGTAALSGRIFAGYPTKDGSAFKGTRHDVTGDVLKTVAEHIGMNCETTVNIDGKPSYTITIKQVQS